MKLGVTCTTILNQISKSGLATFRNLELLRHDFCINFILQKDCFLNSFLTDCKFGYKVFGET